MRTVTFHKQSFVFENVKTGLHFVVVEALAGITVKLDFEAIVYLADRFHGDPLEHVKVCRCFFITVFYTLEPGARFIIHFGMFFGFLVVSDVEFVEKIFIVLSHFFKRRPLVCRNYELAKLRAPVSQVVDSHHVVAEMLEYAIKCPADDRCGQVSDVERLCDIDGTIVYANRLACAFVRRADFVIGCTRKSHLGNCVSVKKHVEISAYHFHFFNKRKTFHSRQKFLCDSGRRNMHRACKLETRQTYIAEFGFFWRFERVFDVLNCQSVNGKRI